MNILLLSWRGPGHPNAGGAEISTHEHAKAWVKKGHSVTLFTSYYQGAKREEKIDGVTILRAGGQFIEVQLKAFEWFLFTKHPKFDLVVDEFHGIPFFTPLYVRAKKLAFIHEVTGEVWGLNPWNRPFNLIPKILGPIFEPLIFKLLYKKITFMTVSESTKKDLINFGIPQKHIIVINNGFDKFNTENNLSKEKEKTVIFLGALAKDKGIEEALKAFSILSQSGDNFQFWIVGKSDPEYLQFLKRQIKELNINTKVRFWGFVSQKEKFNLLKRSHVLIHPAIREGWGLVVIEAASVGVPTVAFDVPGLRDSVIHDKTGIICKEKSPESLAKAIINLLQSSVKYKEMSRSAVSWSKNFSWEKATKSSLKLIEEVVNY